MDKAQQVHNLDQSQAACRDMGVAHAAYYKAMVEEKLGELAALELTKTFIMGLMMRPPEHKP